MATWSKLKGTVPLVKFMEPTYKIIRPELHCTLRSFAAHCQFVMKKIQTKTTNHLNRKKRRDK